MSDLFPRAPREFMFSGDDLVREAHREHGMRLSVYDSRVAAGKMTRADADRKIAMQRVIIRVLQAHALGKTFKEPAP